jgi:hypothetical protein
MPASSPLEPRCHTRRRNSLIQRWSLPEVPARLYRRESTDARNLFQEKLYLFHAAASVAASSLDAQAFALAVS